MMDEQDIAAIPLEELEADLQASINDICWCQTALNLGIDEIKGQCLRQRLFKNCEFVEIIQAELTRRSAMN